MIQSILKAMVKIIRCGLGIRVKLGQTGVFVSLTAGGIFLSDASFNINLP